MQGNGEEGHARSLQRRVRAAHHALTAHTALHVCASVRLSLARENQQPSAYLQFTASPLPPSPRLPPWRIVPICAYFRCSLSLAPVSLCALFWPAAIVSVEIDCWFGFTSWLQNGECASSERKRGRGGR